jgi:hypothetical protein
VLVVPEMLRDESGNTRIVCVTCVNSNETTIFGFFGPKGSFKLSVTITVILLMCAVSMRVTPPCIETVYSPGCPAGAEKVMTSRAPDNFAQ